MASGSKTSGVNRPLPVAMHSASPPLLNSIKHIESTQEVTVATAKHMGSAIADASQESCTCRAMSMVWRCISGNLPRIKPREHPRPEPAAARGCRHS